MIIAVYAHEASMANGSSFSVLVPTGALSHEETFAKDIPAGCKYKVVDLENSPEEKAELEKAMYASPNTPNYWSAWTPNLDDPTSPLSFTIDMEKAKNAFIQHIRILRDSEFPNLDIQYSRADETGNTALKAEIAAKKQKLRDMPSDTRIVNCTDFETLKSLTYETLRDS